ncbi:MAG: hypothetical protein Q8P31_10465 [Bacillota bacterium]|nr:hypothetical protein [Bacillota bacterium]
MSEVRHALSRSQGGGVGDFVLAVLRRSGALVEDLGYAISEAVLPESLVQDFGAEHLLMAFDQEVAAENAGSALVAHGSPLLDAAVRLGVRYGRHTRLYWPGMEPSPPRNLARRVQDAIEYRRCRSPQITLTWAAECLYYLFNFTCTLWSYDKQETLLSVAVNGHTGIPCPGLGQRWEALVPADSPAYELGKAALRPLAELYAVARSEVEAQAQAAALDYRRESDRLFKRDTRRTRQYYEGTIAELIRRKEAAKDPGRSERAEQQIQAARLDWKRRREDILARYRVQADVRLDHLVAWAVPCVFAKVRVQHKSSLLEHVVLYNPVTGEVEPVRCPRCGKATRSLAPADDKELVCPEH